MTEKEEEQVKSKRIVTEEPGDKSQVVFCPDCISFGVECHVDAEDWYEPCSYFRQDG